MSAVHQFVPKLEPGAVGYHTLEVQRVLRGAGYDSEIYALDFAPAWSDRGSPCSEFRPRDENDVLLYQYAIGSSLVDFLMNAPGRLVVNSHTQTPPGLLSGWDLDGAAGVMLGMHQLAAMAQRAVAAFAVSEFNAAELRLLGYQNISVIPVFTPVREYAVSELARHRAGSGAVWLFVGRVSPNKMQHKIVQAFSWYRKVYDPGAQLVLAGGGMEGRYGRALWRYISRLNLDSAVRCAGRISDEELDELYRSSDVFVCLSEHEGFCVPLIEAMRSELPVVARALTAVPETIGDAGLLLDTSRPSIVAAAVHRVLEDDALRKNMVAAGTARAMTFDPGVCAAAFLDAIRGVVA
ncbi:MAG: glycosyltransferase family 4 protein [Acidimicrobiia bacterium]